MFTRCWAMAMARSRRPIRLRLPARTELAQPRLRCRTSTKSGNLGVVIGNLADNTEVLIGNGDGTLDDSASGPGPAALNGCCCRSARQRISRNIGRRSWCDIKSGQPDRISKYAECLDDGDNHHHADGHCHSVSDKHHNGAVDHGHYYCEWWR